MRIMNNWISVKDKLPELKNKIPWSHNNMVSDPVYITCRHNDRNYTCPIPCILHSNGNWYNDAASIKEWVNLDSNDDITEDPIKTEVIAWMPMMEPYDENKAVNKIDQLKKEIKDWAVFDVSVKNGEYIEEHVNILSYENVIDIIDKTLL